MLRGFLLASVVISAACGSKGAGPAGGGADAADLGLLPADSMIVAGVNVKQMQTSALYKEYVEPRIASGDVAAKIADVNATCGFDPKSAVTSVSLGAKGMSGGAFDAIFVVHGLEKTKTLECFDKLKAKLEAEGITFTKSGDFVTVTNRGDNGVLTFVNDSTMVVGTGSYANESAVKGAAAGTSALKSSPAFVDMYNKLDTSKSIWFFVNGKLSVLEQASGFIGIKPKSVFGAINIADTLSIDARIRAESDAKAAEFTKNFASQADGLKQGGMATAASITSEGPDVRMQVTMTPAQIKQTAAQLLPFVRMMAGGM
jgi:hypothetical protein